jgi:L-malate glycosyltransferase
VGLIGFLNKKYISEKYPPLIIHLYYLLVSITFSYLYYHKFINRADFFSPDSSGGMYAVVNFEAIKPIQFRILIPFIFKAAKLLTGIPDKMLFFLITIGITYLILLAFYFLLNQYFQSRALNCWLSPIIIYPMIWNFVIMNGQFFYMDFSILLIIVLGFYAIVSEKFNLLILVFTLGVLNHPSAGYLILAFLFYRYNLLFKPKTIIYAVTLVVLYVVYYKTMDAIFEKTQGYFVIFNLYRNLGISSLIPAHIIARDLFLNFGGIHIFLLVFLFAGNLKRFLRPMLFINLVIIPYVISVLISFSIEELRNYIAIIPFVLILALVYLSSFPNSFLKPVDRIKDEPDKIPSDHKKNNLKILYLSSNGGIHDYRFLEKLVADYEVLFLHYSSVDMIDEIRFLKNLKIVSKKPLLRSFPLISELFHFKKIYNEFKPDIIHSGYVWQVGILPALLNLNPHLSMVWGSDVLIEPDKNFLLKKIVRKVLNQSDHIQCDANFVKDKILKDFNINNKKVTVFPWGINLKLFEPLDKKECRNMTGLERDVFVVHFTRALEKIYGINTMLEGFKEFSEGKEDVRLVITSDGSMKNYVKDFTSQNNLSQKIDYRGWVKYSELPFYYNSADVYLSTSLSDGTSLSLLEALACGLGMVVTDLPANREWIVNRENGFLVNAGDKQEVRVALEKYYFDRSLIKKHGSVNLDIARNKADFEKNYLLLKDIYKKIAVNC